MAGKLQVHTFNCVKCGGRISSRGMLQTVSVVCGNCGTIVDPSDKNLRVLGEFKQRFKEAPLIPLGEMGTLRGEKWQVIGFLRRSIQVEGERYAWSEYLLFNPYLGFRWLTEYQGHWNYARQCVERPSGTSYRGTTFKHFQSAAATVEYVIGEFYWQVQAQDECAIADYVAPPLMLSRETSGNEVTWSIGEYIEATEIRNAFQLENPLPGPQGIFANQPAPYANSARYLIKMAAIFMAAVILMQLATVALSQNKRVYGTQFLFDPAAQEKSVVSDVFALDGRPSNVVVRTNATLSNAWIFLGIALINDETGVAYDFGREISFYDGTDEDGYWTEGDRGDSVTIPAVPAGNYYLRVEPEGAFSNVPYTVEVYRDIPDWRLFFAALGALAIIPIGAWLFQARFEYKRWAESDHPWLSTDS